MDKLTDISNVHLGLQRSPTRKCIRLRDYDYASPAAYFVTICVKPRKNVFWQSLNVGAAISCPPTPELTDIGHIVHQTILQIPDHYPHITVDNYCIMPDHLHLLLTIHPDGDGRQVAAPTLSVVIGHFKRHVSKQLRYSIWQKSFSERVIRNDQGYRAAWEYIDNNPLKKYLYNK